MTKPVDPDPRRALLDAKDAEAQQGGGAARVERHHRDRKLTARERIDLLLDPGSFVELDRLKTHRCGEFGLQGQKVPGGGVVAGHGLVDGRPVAVYAQDATVFGGSLSGANAEKICKVMDLALEVGCPVVGLLDSAGARIQEGVAALAGYADVFLRNTRASGVVPQLSVIMGPCAGSAVYTPAISDLVFMVKGTAAMFTASPELVKAVTGEEVSREALGGAQTHAALTGVAHFALDTEEGALRAVRTVLGFLPSRSGEAPPLQPCRDPADRQAAGLATLVPEDPARPYDMREALRAVLDDGLLLEVGELHAPNLVTGLGRLGGRPVGVVANQPTELGGALDVKGTVKAARFVRLCDAFDLPLLTFVDVPGFLPGTAQEWGGLIHHGAKLLYAYAEATVPKVTVITRKAYGGAYAIMASKHLEADLNLAWPGAEIAVTSPDGAVGMLFRKELLAAKDPTAERARLVSEYRDKYANPYVAAELGYVDEVIRPEQTRARLVRALDLLASKRRPPPRRRHGNIPL